MTHPPHKDTAPILGETVSYEAIETRSKAHFRNTLGYAAASVALAGTLYVGVPSEVHYAIQDFLGFAGQGITDKIQQGGDFSDQPAPVIQGNPFGHGH